MTTKIEQQLIELLLKYPKNEEEIYSFLTEEQAKIQRKEKENNKK